MLHHVLHYSAHGSDCQDNLGTIRYNPLKEACIHVTFFETVDPELMIVHPMGILITYVRGDRALVTG